MHGVCHFMEPFISIKYALFLTIFFLKLTAYEIRKTVLTNI